MARLLRLLLVLLCFVSLTAQSFAAINDPKLNEYRSFLSKNHRPWINGRRLSEYYDLLGTGFMFHLSRLKANHLWIDMGCGSGQAIKDYYGFYSPLVKRKRQIPTWPLASLGIWVNYLASKIVSSHKKARVLAFDKELNLSYWEELNKTLMPWQKELYEKVSFVPGYFLEDFDLELNVLSKIGKADIISDVFGVMSYTFRPDLVLQKYLNSLNSNGKIYILAFDTTLGNHHMVIKSDGKKVSLKNWIRSINGLKARNVNFWSAIQIDKPKTQIEIPKLKLVYFNTKYMPPIRTFQEI